MGLSPRVRRLLVLRGVWAALGGLLLLGLASVAQGASAAGGPKPLRTAIADPPTYSSRYAATALARTHAAGATFVVLAVHWRRVAGARKPRPGAVAHYDWRAVRPAGFAGRA